ncbi:hypothetical protein F4677DRAFT_444399 [Hypoxylon crocopeplum]|nr:hypothetical protein F4677DRAFT_444399 [Hypoxylon crocopeplum]
MLQNVYAALVPRKPESLGLRMMPFTERPTIIGTGVEEERFWPYPDEAERSDDEGTVGVREAIWELEKTIPKAGAALMPEFFPALAGGVIHLISSMGMQGQEKPSTITQTIGNYLDDVANKAEAEAHVMRATKNSIDYAELETLRGKVNVALSGAQGEGVAAIAEKASSHDQLLYSKAQEIMKLEYMLQLTDGVHPTQKALEDADKEWDVWDTVIADAKANCEECLELLKDLKG